MILIKLREQCPKTEIGVLLAWANVSKNSLQMWHGFSSYQIVLGKNPNLPNTLTDEVPALEGSTTSETLARHLDSLHKARRAFIQSEADERIRRALRSKVRASEQVFEPGDHVFYKRDGHDRWLGLGKVIFQDGKVVFVRHGSIFVRVSLNRLLKAGCEYATSESVSTPQCRGDEFLSNDLLVKGVAVKLSHPNQYCRKHCNIRLFLMEIEFLRSTREVQREIFKSKVKTGILRSRSYVRLYRSKRMLRFLR